MGVSVSGAIRVPGDKSISHRALMLGALGDGPSRVRGVLRGADVESTASVLRALGVDSPPHSPVAPFALFPFINPVARVGDHVSA